MNPKQKSKLDMLISITMSIIPNQNEEELRTNLKQLQQLCLSHTEIIVQTAEILQENRANTYYFVKQTLKTLYNEYSQQDLGVISAWFEQFPGHISLEKVILCEKAIKLKLKKEIPHFAFQRVANRINQTLRRKTMEGDSESSKEAKQRSNTQILPIQPTTNKNLKEYQYDSQIQQLLNQIK
ncbi:hypothetical protein SS50377_26174 [Spironucleus salmonicida]|uniref:Uncharacterized protein n=1 Tax=Spironucleus salmonicida TaxID=348837 RepID=V6LMH5_9EUKA|nr:hypothetical protein SS50377_26174 [Spironucleus salmonicida]|eukprot:EST44906.1 Hypothetical protein SS50377_15200 [Spironucleus salmonicida]